MPETSTGPNNLQYHHKMSRSELDKALDAAFAAINLDPPFLEMDLIYTIDQVDSPFVVRGTLAERTILRFSGNSPKVMAWIKHRARERILHPCYEWIETQPA